MHVHGVSLLPGDFGDPLYAGARIVTWTCAMHPHSHTSQSATLHY